MKRPATTDLQTANQQRPIQNQINATGEMFVNGQPPAQNQIRQAENRETDSPMDFTESSRLESRGPDPKMRRLLANRGQKVAILDCGAQYGKLIDRRCRELSVESELLPLNTRKEDLLVPGEYRALIITGGPKSVFSDDAPHYDTRIFEPDFPLPILGICYGFQLINKAFGGMVEKSTGAREDGTVSVWMDKNCSIFSGLNTVENVLLTHGDKVSRLPHGFRTISKLQRGGELITGIANESDSILGVQFHPEVDLTTSGRRILRNFLYNVACCNGSYTMDSREEQGIDEIKRRCGTEQKVLVLVSGGVDSTVCAALCLRALGGERVIAVHIDNGFMRYQESENVERALRELGLEHLYVCRGTLSFLHEPCELAHSREDPWRFQDVPVVTEVLSEMCDPEMKRTIIGDTFMKIKDRILKKLKLDPDRILLVQGTLRPDLIESASALASGAADTIKTHHNDTPLVRKLREQNRVIEPLKDFHKDEVRRLGRDLGLPDTIVERHPFPGPGLAIRILCADRPFAENDFEHTESLLQLICRLREAEFQHNPLIEKHLMGRISDKEYDWLRSLSSKADISALLLPIRTVGVQGDHRSYKYAACVSTECAPINVPWQEIMELAKLIPRLLTNINRVVFAFGHPLEHSVRDVTPTYLCPQTIRQARHADFSANRVLSDPTNFKYWQRIAQMPVVLLPIHFDREALTAQMGVAPSCRRSICLRPFITQDFMTGTPATPGRDIPLEVIMKMVNAILRDVNGISRVLYDLTPKPPGTTEWE